MCKKGPEKGWRERLPSAFALFQEADLFRVLNEQMRKSDSGIGEK